jgi:hypothetical protein
MRNVIYAGFLLTFASTAALAQTQTAQRPSNPAPAANAAFELREAWCMKYAEWFVSQRPTQGARPADVRATQQLENELSYCKLDPQQYERETIAELNLTPPARG